ncbi:FecCD family ABC transporter permease [Corynebacterium endometrii]|uniref:Iron-uptake system permease protein FeuC n=1 Tax=Corynebacterium endometrii TaxID=2488819 RepID=A0A4P7QHF2_9CORY|nr:iron chelate uptake ABC transporter family permease subunit [Corynebacterium endometrii]QCB29115.1 Iron-uptake system permease protein FeuC [Corynebacterium endometrii]
MTSTPAASFNDPRFADADTNPSARVLRRLDILTVAVLILLLLALCVISLLFGETTYSISELMQVLSGQVVPGASYSIGEIRLPRLVLGVLVGLAFGLSGSVFQTMLRNQLASPDIIGISAGASATGVVAILVFRLPQTLVSLWALVGALLAAAGIYVLSFRRGSFAGTRLILVGIGFTAILQSVVTFVLSRAAAWDLPTATRWLNGSLNGATWERIIPVGVAAIVVLPIVVVQLRNLKLLRLGDETAAALGVNVSRSRAVLIIGAVTLISVATAAAGPIAFVAFMSGPIAARLLRGGMFPPLVAAIVGALLTVGADFVGQNLLGARYPVGVVTGVLGAPFLIYLLIRSQRQGM